MHGYGQTDPQRDGTVVFGTTVISSSGLVGQIYSLPKDSDGLPNFKKMKSQGAVYTTTLNIPPREFKQGFPGSPNNTEWFALDYRGNFWVEVPGKYQFALMSDDGSKLYIDNKTVIDNDGLHAPQTETGSIKLKAGLHTIRVSYFQGPGYYVALSLSVAKPGEPMKIFNMNDFLPPASVLDDKKSITFEK